MAQVVRVAVVVRDEVHERVFVLCSRVLAQEFFDRVPQGRDRGVELVDRNREPVHLVVLPEHRKWVVINVAVEIHVRLHSPVIPVLLQERVSVEESRVISTHVAITLRVCVDNAHVGHLVPLLSGLVLVDEVRVRPVFCWDQSEFGLSRNHLGNFVFKLVRKRFIVEKHPVIMEVAIEPVLQVLDRPHNAAQVLVTTKTHDRGVFLWHFFGSQIDHPVRLFLDNGSTVLGPLEIVQVAQCQQRSKRNKQPDNPNRVQPQSLANALYHHLDKENKLFFA
ncbi:hypothetical protein OGAPHI_000785 [Ogataea philodendri]|uniref:Uncharacterized protein n=1 Tax=Ogataea philodendri TaxID=1378263 RepID=A0A9P8T9Z1_9ASCO|nr:uncharacterized protein OGAPHI_000785 [Ogataea philodendri]KAH3671074.1 hypothetical protein OGAPHI_000785 [Ogataea philodendri]